MAKLRKFFSPTPATAQPQARPLAGIGRLFGLITSAFSQRDTGLNGVDSGGVTFFSFMQGIIDGMEREGKSRTAENYQAALGSLRKFMDGGDFAPCELTKEMLSGYETWLVRMDTARNTLSLYMRILRAVYNRAVIEGLTIDRQPFRSVYTGMEKTEKRAVDSSEIKRVKLLRLGRGTPEELARDVFMLSFYFRGMSFIDMAFLRKTDLSDGVLTYHRRKTGQKLCISWENCMRRIVSKHPVKSDSPYLLPLIDPSAGDEYTQYRNMQKKINRHLKVIGRMADLSLPLTMYVSRHSWASIAKSRNIPIDVISEGMGHESESTTRIYLASFDNSRIDRANRIVIKGL